MSLPRCKFWDECYRKNPDHLKRYLHPSKPDNNKNKTVDQVDNENKTRGDDANKNKTPERDDGKKKTLDEDLIKPKTSEPDDNEETKRNREATPRELEIEGTSTQNCDRKRRASDCGVHEEKDGDDDDDDGDTDDMPSKKKVKLIEDETEAEREEITMEKSGAEADKTVKRSKEKNGKNIDEVSDEDDDDDDDDDFLTIVSTAKKEETKQYDDAGATKDEGSETLSSSTPREWLKAKYSMEFPSDLYDFWNFCCSKSPLNPTKALAEGGLLLVGPFDVLSAKRSGRDLPSDADVHLHWRFFFDPPEFMTAFAVTASDAADYEEMEGMHYGYFRDDPKDLPTFVASSSKDREGTLTRVGGNLFAAAVTHLNAASKIVDSKKRKQRMKGLMADLTAAAKAKGHEVGVKTEAEKKREKKVVAKPFHGVGMVVPFDKKTEVGYRELPETNSKLKKMFAKWCEAPADVSTSEAERLFAGIQEILTFIQFANDECDYGMGLEMGLDLFSYGHDKFQQIVLSVLPLAYKLLDRRLFAEISESHLKNRTDSFMPKLF